MIDRLDVSKINCMVMFYMWEEFDELSKKEKEICLHISNELDEIQNTIEFEDDATEDLKCFSKEQMSVMKRAMKYYLKKNNEAYTYLLKKISQI